MTHLFKLDAAQQQVNWRSTPHIGFFQLLVADHRHADGVRLSRRVALARNVARRNRTFFDFGYRLAGFTVEHKDHALFTGLYQHRRGAAFTIWQVIQQRLRRQVEVPQVVVGCLIVPAYFTGGSVNRHDRGAVFIVERGTFTGPEVWGGVTGWQVNQVQLRVVRHGGPDVRRTARVGHAFWWQTGQIRVARIPCPGKFAGMDIICANYARRFTGREVIGNATADHHHVTRH